jgi:uncharacterized Zn finger protein
MTFAELTWEDLKEWAGSRVVARGKSYRSAIEDLTLTADGRLLAWVEGGDRYATVVTIGKGGKLSSACTCPYAIACKHAVAMVLAYIEAVQAGKSIPAASKDDERLKRLVEAEDDDDLDGDDGDEGDGSETDDDANSGGAVPRKRASKHSRPNDPDAAIRRYLGSLAPSALLDFVRELANDFPEVHQRIADRAALQSGDVAKLLANTRHEIENVSADPGWTRHWSNERHIPDYSRVQKRLESLLTSGHADEVVALGEEIMRRGIQQVEMSDDEGETGQEIAGCMEIVFHALKASSKTVPQRLLWEIDARMRDDYTILDGVEGSLSDRSAGTPADWSAVADNLARRLEAIPTAAAKSDTDGSNRDYRRQAVTRWLLDALKRAGRDQEITAILTREAEITNCYVELVDHLLAGKHKEPAAEWAHNGFERTIEKLPGIAWALEERLRNLAARKRDMPRVAAFRAMEFFDRPDVARYAEVQKATATLGLWDAVRPMLLRWLETGSRPDQAPAEEPARRGRAKGAPPEATRKSAWPLPSTGLLVPGEKGRYRSFPDTATLIAIAIQEKRNDDVLLWYERAGTRGGYWHDHQGETVAEAVQETHPDEALALWLRTVKTQIAMTKPAAYQMAGASLTKMKTVYQRTGRLPEWDRLLVTLRTEHARKPRMIEVLDGLEGKRSRILKS